MLRASQILVRAFVLGAGAVVLLAGCGQRGPLYLPHDPAGSQRATLPQTLDPMREAPSPVPIIVPAPATPASSPSPAPSSPPASTSTP
ncbi:lipoprotein [Acidovorax sp. NCPPB 2350]|nr:lipoprotein [Acidovorax sp. NCPPB 2350]